MKRIVLIGFLVVALINVSGQTVVKDEDGNDTPINVNNGKVGIGIGTDHDARLKINSAKANETALRTYGKIQLRGNELNSGDVLTEIRGFNYTVNSNVYLLKVGIAGATNWEKFVIKGDGKVGIGTAEPLSKLQVNGEGRFITKEKSRVNYLIKVGGNTHQSGSAYGISFDPEGYNDPYINSIKNSYAINL